MTRDRISLVDCVCIDFTSPQVIIGSFQVAQTLVRWCFSSGGQIGNIFYMCTKRYQTMILYAFSLVRCQFQVGFNPMKMIGGGKRWRGGERSRWSGCLEHCQVRPMHLPKLTPYFASDWMNLWGANGQHFSFLYWMGSISPACMLCSFSPHSVLNGQHFLRVHSVLIGQHFSRMRSVLIGQRFSCIHSVLQAGRTHWMHL